MSQPDPFESQDQDRIPEKKKLSGCAIAGIGCGVIGVLGLIGIILIVVWGVQNPHIVGANVGAFVLKAGLDELDIPEDQRKRIHVRIDELAELVEQQKVSKEQAAAIFEKLSKSPILPAGVSLFVKRVYIRDSGLDEEEKAAADTAIQRFARGVIDNSIPEAKREAVLDMISTKKPDGSREFKQKLTDDELRDFLKAVSEAADEAGVPADVPEVNFADEFDKAIDEALGEAMDEFGGPELMDELVEPLPIEEPEELNHEASETTNDEASDKAESGEARLTETEPTESESAEPATTE